MAVASGIGLASLIIGAGSAAANVVSGIKAGNAAEKAGTIQAQAADRAAARTDAAMREAMGNIETSRRATAAAYQPVVTTGMAAFGDLAGRLGVAAPTMAPQAGGQMPSPMPSGQPGMTGAALRQPMSSGPVQRPTVLLESPPDAMGRRTRRAVPAEMAERALAAGARRVS